MRLPSRLKACALIKAGIFMLTAAAVQAAPPKALAPELLDWQVYAPLPAGEVCHGYYAAPELDLPEASLTVEQARLFADAAEVTYSTTRGLLLQGDVRLRKGPLYLTADKAQMSADQNLTQLTGNLSLRQNGLLLRGAKGEYHLQEQRLQMSEAHYVVHDQRLRGSAWQLEQRADGVVVLRDTSLTSCAPNDNAWRLVAGRLNLNRETGFGDAFNVRMEVLSVPVFYWPWLRFPIDDRRHTGLLSPNFSWSKSKGFDYLQPFYWTIAPNVDATFFPRQISKRGFMLGGEVRYLTQNNAGEIYYARLNGDRVFDDYDRWHFSAKHQGAISIDANSSDFSYQLNYSQVSDDRYLDDLGNSRSSNSFATADTELLQQLSFNYNHSGWQTRLNFQGYQQLVTSNTAPESPYQLFNLRQGRKADITNYYRLPQLEVRKTTRWGEHWQGALLVDLTQFSGLFDKDFETSSGVKYTGYQVADLALKPNSNGDYYFTQWGVPDALRLHISPSLTAEWRWPWAYVRPQAKLKFNQYSISPYWDDSSASLTPAMRNSVELTPSALVPVFSLDTGLYFERDTQLFDKKMLQTLEPRAFFAYVPFVEQYQIPDFFDGSFTEEDAAQLFRAERAMGLDRVGDLQRVTLGLTQRLISQDTGRELASFGIAKAVYFEDRRLDTSYLHPDAVDGSGNKIRSDQLPREERAYKDVRQTSNLALQASVSLTADLKLSANLLWDDYFQKTDSANTYFTYTGFANSQFNLGHSYTSNYQNLGFKGRSPSKANLDNWSYLEQAEEQVYASMIYALNQHWRIFAKQGHDLKRSEKLDSLTGVEYNTCCWQLQLVYRDWVDNLDTSPAYQQGNTEPFASRKRDYGVFVQVVFKGLGGVGQSIPQLLETEVQGYTDRP